MFLCSLFVAHANALRAMTSQSPSEQQKAPLVWMYMGDVVRPLGLGKIITFM